MDRVTGEIVKSGLEARLIEHGGPPIGQCAQLAYDLQRALYSPTGNSASDETVKRCKDEGLTHAAAFVATVLDGNERSVDYETGNLDVWLRGFGLETRIAKDGPENIPGPGPILVNREIFRDGEILGKDVQDICDHISTTLSNKFPSVGEKYKPVLGAVAVVTRIMSEQTAALAVGKQLDTTNYNERLNTAFAPLGITVEAKNSRS